MSRLGILHPDSLLGEELKRALEARPELWTEIKLLSPGVEDYATVSAVAGEAVVVQDATAESLAALDLLFVCPHADFVSARHAELLAATGTVVHVAPAQPVEGATPVVDGINLERARRGAVLVSPDPGAVVLAHLLHPLEALGLHDAIAWVAQPASTGDQRGVDELLDQTRRLLAFDSELPQDVFGRRLANNVYPDGLATPIADSVLATLGGDLTLTVERIQAAIFHGVAVSVYARCDPTTTAERARAALEEDRFLQPPTDGRAPGPVEAAGSEDLSIAHVRSNPREPGGLWLWGVADNLTFAGAGNALAIAEAILTPSD